MIKNTQLLTKQTLVSLNLASHAGVALWRSFSMCVHTLNIPVDEVNNNASLHLFPSPTAFPKQRCDS